MTSYREIAMAPLQDHAALPGTAPFQGGGQMVGTPAGCPWHPLPEDAIVHLVAIERRAQRKHPTGPPTQPARVVWGVAIRRDASTTDERYDLPIDVFRALAHDGGGPIQPMTAVAAPRLNAAVERANGISHDGDPET
jgi:hypothetical protein